MIKLVYCDVSDLDLAKTYQYLSDERKEKVNSFRFDKDKRLSAGAYLLLMKLLDEENIAQPAFETGKYGKAYIANCEDIHFNLSHSGKVVACAISDMEVGVDVEYNDPEIDLNIAKHYFFNTEYESIMNSKNPSDALLDIYSEYIDEKDEIGKLTRSYTDLIKHNNHYIDNIHEIESEKERIKAELDIATKIQASNLPTEALETDEYIVEGYSKPAKEVGGDFFDYYPIDDSNLALVIGDASGKGVPAALLATITQVMIKQILQHENDPSQVLYSLNNQLCENNSESMFITVWLGIYNKNTGKITFSNAGHNPPLIKINDEFEYLNMDTGIVLGIMEDFEFVKEEMAFSSELALYTDGITDADNYDEKMYGEERLLKFFNEYGSNENPINGLLNDIKAFTKEKEQYDDMTLIYLKKK